MKHRERHSRFVLAVAAAVAGAMLVSAGLVVAQSGDGDPESGVIGDVRHASPPRTSAPREVAQGLTSGGRPYVLKLSYAGRLTCVAVEYGSPRRHASVDPVVSLKGSELCVDPSQRSLSASIEQLFVDPETGEVSETPQRFVYGVVEETADEVALYGPQGHVEKLQLSDAPGALKVFAGSLTRHPAGTGAVVARDARGSVTAQQTLRFAAPRRMSDAELAERLERAPE